MAGLLNELLNYIDGAKRTARNNLAMWLEDPQQAALNTAEGLQGQIDAFRADPAGRVGDMLPGGAAFGGIIRKGGMPELVAVHQAPVDRYAVWTRARGQLPQELQSPSIGINKGAITQDFGKESGFGGTIDFVMRPGALDPAVINARLHNRDAYTPRDAYYKGGRSELLGATVDELRASGARFSPEQLRRTFANDRLTDRWHPGDLRLKESNTTDLMQQEHRQAINSSPSFRDFAHFEADPRGAALLTEDKTLPQRAAVGIRDAASAAIQRLAGEGNKAAYVLAQHPLIDPLELLHTNPNLWTRQEGAAEVKKVLQAYRRDLAYLPSQYAELKVNGPVQLRSNNFAGAVIRPDAGSKFGSAENVNAIADLLRQRGIPTMINDPAAPLTPQDLGWLARAYSEGVLK